MVLTHLFLNKELTSQRNGYCKGTSKSFMAGSLPKLQSQLRWIVLLKRCCCVAEKTKVAAEDGYLLVFKDQYVKVFGYILFELKKILKNMKLRESSSTFMFKGGFVGN
ncbi:hypothetical protein Tco_0579658 [Tanacetum coccineum]